MLSVKRWMLRWASGRSNIRNQYLSVPNAFQAWLITWPVHLPLAESRVLETHTLSCHSLSRRCWGPPQFTLHIFCGKSGARTHTPLGPTVFKTAELSPHCSYFSFCGRVRYRSPYLSVPLVFKTRSSASLITLPFCSFRGIRTPIWSFVATCPVHWTMKLYNTKKPSDYPRVYTISLYRQLWTQSDSNHSTRATWRTWYSTL